jgi:hypothetical protein
MDSERDDHSEPLSRTGGLLYDLVLPWESSEIMKTRIRQNVAAVGDDRTPQFEDTP